MGTVFQLCRQFECVEYDDDISEDSLSIEDGDSSYGNSECNDTFDGQASPPNIAKSRRNNNRNDSRQIARRMDRNYYGDSVNGSSAASSSEGSVSSGSSGGDDSRDSGVSAFSGFISWSP